MSYFEFLSGNFIEIIGIPEFVIIKNKIVIIFVSELSIHWTSKFSDQMKP